MKALALILAAIVVFAALIWLFQRSLIYFPTGGTPPLGALAPGAEEVTFPTDDGLTLAGWFLSAAGGSRGTVIVFSGNAGNRAHRVPLAEGLADRGYAVLLVDYRGYGGNPGRPNEAGLTLDAAAARSYVETRPDVDPGRLAYFGESLGAAVALRLAADEPPSALVLRSPFTSLVEVGRVHYPMLPVSLLLRDRYDSTGLVTRIDSPLMVIAGSADAIVPPEQSRRLYEQAGSEVKRLLVVEGADHNDPELSHGAGMVLAVAAFLDEVVP